MDTQFFEEGNFIYECKSSPTRIDDYFNTAYLNSSIRKLKARWKLGNLPSGYRYVFPVNYLDDDAIEAIHDLQDEYPSVDIKYYDCDSVQRLIDGLDRVGDLPSLVAYLEEIMEE